MVFSHSNLAFGGKKIKKRKERKKKDKEEKGKEKKEKLRHCFRTGELHGRTKVFWKIRFRKMAVPLCISAFLLNRTFFLSCLYLKYCRAT